MSRPQQRGVDYLVIPCKPDEHKGIRPDYIHGLNLRGPFGQYRYRCPRCNSMFYGYHAAAKHMGLVSNIMGNCNRR
jgi:hypothetical protein